MEIYVGNINASTSREQLQDFFKGFDKQATFKIKRVKGKYELFVFGLVTIPSERQAKKAIKRLHMKKLDGKIIVVREFLHRASHNERRNVGWRSKKWNTVERRNNERRTIRLPRITQYITYAA